MSNEAGVQGVPFNLNADYYRRFPLDQEALYASIWSKIYSVLVQENGMSVSSAKDLLQADSVCIQIMQLISEGKTPAEIATAILP